MSKVVSIYALTEPGDYVVRYIGQTVDTVARLKQHITSPVNAAMARWVGELKAAGKSPEMIVIEEVSEDEAVAAERRWMIHYRDKGAPLTNIVFGDRTKQLNIRFYEAELADIRSAAGDADLDVSEWVRLVVLYAAGRHGVLPQQMERASEVGAKLVAAELGKALKRRKAR